VNLSSDPNDLSADAQKAGLAGKQILIGGLNQVLMNAEIEFPILKEAKIRGVIFADVGNAFNDLSKISGPKLYANLGWGFRWFTPIGPLRFEFGYPMVNSGASKFFFTIGPPF
jgi:outer membrane protein insertion porin family